MYPQGFSINGLLVFIFSATSSSLQGPKCYLTHFDCSSTRQALDTDIPLTERQRAMVKHVSTSLMFFSLPLGVGRYGRVVAL